MRLRNFSLLKYFILWFYDEKTSFKQDIVQCGTIPSDIDTNFLHNDDLTVPEFLAVIVGLIR